VDWIDVAREGNTWRDFMNAVMNFRVSLNATKFVASWGLSNIERMGELWKKSEVNMSFLGGSVFLSLLPLPPPFLICYFLPLWREENAINKSTETDYLPKFLLFRFEYGSVINDDVTLIFTLYSVEYRSISSKRVFEQTVTNVVPVLFYYFLHSFVLLCLLHRNMSIN
jgi:hypothetical protein